ncbi:hypothetical protein CDIK_2089 [Cucumispora dikerogammari]|nr:hypothetical protein CDIK_2089 [Cucumispora dikerogammari]
MTCFAQILHNRALRIKNHFKNIIFLIFLVKKGLIKSINRREKFVNMPLSAQFTITRLGSWLKACKEYYYKYLPNVSEIIRTFVKGSKIRDKVLDGSKNTPLTEDLIYIHKNYKFL